MQDTMKTLWKHKDIKGLIKIKDDYPIYSRKAACYIERIKRKTKGL